MSTNTIDGFFGSLNQFIPPDVILITSLIALFTIVGYFLGVQRLKILTLSFFITQAVFLAVPLPAATDSLSFGPFGGAAFFWTGIFLVITALFLFSGIAGKSKGSRQLLTRSFLHAAALTGMVSASLDASLTQEFHASASAVWRAFSHPWALVSWMGAGLLVVFFIKSAKKPKKSK